jgi:hypothetical protein
MTENNEQRHFHRIFYQAQVTLNDESTQWPCELIDISLHGCLLRFDKDWVQNNLETRVIIIMPEPSRPKRVMVFFSGIKRPICLPPITCRFASGSLTLLFNS